MPLNMPIELDGLRKYLARPKANRKLHIKYFFLLLKFKLQ